MRFCKNCGSKINASVVSCGLCGEHVQSEKKSKGKGKAFLQNLCQNLKIIKEKPLICGTPFVEDIYTKHVLCADCYVTTTINAAAIGEGHFCTNCGIKIIV